MNSSLNNSFPSKISNHWRKDTRNLTNHSLISVKIINLNISRRVKTNTIVINMSNHRNPQKSLRKKQSNLFAPVKEIKHPLSVIIKATILKKEIIKMMPFLRNNNYSNHNSKLLSSSIILMSIRQILSKRKIPNLLSLSLLFWGMYHRIIPSLIQVISIKLFPIIWVILISMISMLTITLIQGSFLNHKSQISTRLNNKKSIQIC